MPRRRCVGCGRIAPKHELLRVAVEPPAASAGARAVIDAQARMPGRGAYLCAQAGSGRPDAACVALAERRRAIPRALRAAVTLDPEIVESVGR